MTFEAAIFDLDGTLLNSMHVWEQIDIEFLQKRGLPVPADYVVEICARSFEEAAQYTIELFGLPETIDDIIKEWNVMAAYEYAYNVKIQSYAMDYLLQLKSRGIKLAVATGLPKELFIPCLKNNSVLHLFDVLCSTDEVRHGKECPDVFELAAKRLRVVPERCIVFDDVLPAIKSAKMANVIACGIYDKYSAHNQTEIEEIADSYIFNFKEAPFPCKEV
ncbi:HAD family phosphatase [Lachnospiraceae bacterium MD335]|nr:HAD family phosphatase [Lachnospiraceae bacterium MD335]